MPPRDISVLVMPIPACPELEAFRSAEMNKPTEILGPHVSILGPLVPQDLTPPIIQGIAKVVATHASIGTLLEQFCVFADVPALYLSVYPVTPFEALRDAILRVLPDHEPEFRGPTFHVTLAIGFDLGSLPELMTRAHAQLDAVVPLEIKLQEVVSFDRLGGKWTARETFRLRDDDHGTSPPDLGNL
ncbi:MAG: 2'-5' RNA ligase family protein [Candidatus Eisenbacteria bacterium]